MITRGLNFIRGCVCTFLICLNMIVHAMMILLIGGICWLIMGCRGLPKTVMQIVLPFQTSWSFLNLCILKLSMLGKWDVQGDSPIHRKHWYILISNHQSWMDIIVLSGVFCRNASPVKFFLKKELLWSLPLAGACCYLLGYPFMERHTRADIRKNPELKGKDIETTKQACNKFKMLPTTVINFAEGTRFTTKKHEQQASPYRHLLKPKAGGTAIVINELHEHLDGVLNVTINYDTDNLSFFNLLCGNIRKLSVHYELLPIEAELLGNYYEDRAYRSVIQRWFNTIWERKDNLLDKLKSHDN